MRIAPSGRFSREAREPDQHHRSIWLLASPHCPDIQNCQNLGRLRCLRSYLSVYLGQGMCGSLPMSQNNPRTAAKYVSINNISLKSKKLTARVLQSP